MTSKRLTSGRPRSDTSKAALIQAAYELLREVGFERMTIDAIAARAGVGKATIYRWYETKDDLVIEALIATWQVEKQFIPDTGSLSSDLQAMLQYTLENDPVCFNRQSLALTMTALAGSPQLAKTYWDLYVTKKRAGFKIVFERAKQRRELAADADTDLFLDLFHGYVLFGLLVRPKGVVSNKAVGTAIKHLLEGFGGDR
jgi:AcrR family transcriptional regulator